MKASSRPHASAAPAPPSACASVSPVPDRDPFLMPILMLTGDLVFASRAAGAAARIGVTLRTAATPESLVEQLAAAGAGALVVLDLTTRGFDPHVWVPRFRESVSPPSAILAYGPHVQEASLAAAVEAGCDRVFSRGQFNARMDEIFAESKRTA